MFEGKNLSFVKFGLLLFLFSIVFLFLLGFFLVCCCFFKYEKVVFFLMVMINICLYICVKCIFYDLFLNWIYMVVNMDIRISDKIVIIMVMIFLKGRKNNKIVFKLLYKFL